MRLVYLITQTILFVSFLTLIAVAQDAQLQSSNQVSAAISKTTTSPKSSDEIEDIKRQLLEQQQEIQQLRSLIAEQAKLIEKTQNATAQASTGASSTAQAPAQDELEKRLEKVEAAAKKTSDDILKNQLGTLNFSGDMRLQYDSIYGQLNNAANIDNPSILGNELNSRHRGRIRLRLAIRGKIGNDVFSGFYAANGDKRLEKEFDWGIRLSTGSLGDVGSSNQILTDFYNRKQFALDQAYVAWRPRPLPGLRIIAGKFETPWTHTELTFDNDIQVEGLGETYSRDIKNSALKNITLSAWQLPMLERNSTFIRNANGTVNFEESSRGGRDLGLFGAQIQAKFGLSPKTNLTLALSDLNFAGTNGIDPLRVTGNQLQLPVTVTIPASGATPARTVTGNATISRDLLVAGNANLGLTTATNAAVNRDGRLASGFNLVNLLGRLDFNQYKHAPITLILDYVRNTQTRDVIAADAFGNNVFLENNENDGFWGEIQFKSLRKNRVKDKFDDPVQGDVLFGYTFMRIEKDAVLTPLNLSDLAQQSDIRAHRLAFTYWVHPRVTFNFTGLFTQRANGLLGPFTVTPPGSLDKTTTRLQFDTVYRF